MKARVEQYEVATMKRENYTAVHLNAMPL